MPFKAKTLAAAVVATALLPAGTAQAQDPATDPEADSPSGTIYEIPLDQGRGDAAPRTGVGAPGGGSGGSGTGTGAGSGADAPVSSSIRSSDNGFSSSPTVPGAERSAGSARKGEGKNGADRSLIDRTRNRERDIPAAPQARVVASGAGSPSITRALLLIGLGAALAAALGLAARQAGRRTV